MSENEKNTNGIGIGTVLFLIFLTLKLANIGQVATWSWWWVTSPLWIPVIIVITVLLIAALIISIKHILD